MERELLGKIKISSTIDNLDDNGLVEDTEKNDEAYEVKITEWAPTAFTIAYHESGEGGETDTLITVKSDTVTVKREGSICSEFVFKESYTHKAVYSIPPFSFDAEIFTRKIRGGITTEGGDMTIIYDMTVGGAKKSVRMKISLNVGRVL